MTPLALEGNDLVQDLCARISEAAGVTLGFTPVHGESATAVKARLCASADLDRCEPVENGRGIIGFLHLRTERGENAPDGRLAGTVAELLTRYHTVTSSLEARTQEMATLIGIGIASRKTQSLPDALSRLLGAAVQLTGYRAAAFFLLCPSTSKLRLRAAFQFEREKLPLAVHELSRSLPDLEALTNGPVYMQRQGPHDEWLPPDMACAMCLAVQSDAVPIGTLWVYDRRLHAFSTHDVHILTAIAAQLASYLERVVLLKESETQQRITSDLRVASESQIGAMTPILSAGRGFAAASRCVSRHELGGDLCELIPFRDGRTGFALGDASGNSIPAALVMSAVRGALRIIPGGRGSEEVHPAQTMERLNDALHSITSAHQFMSLFYGIYDPETRRLTYSNAGHPPPLLVRRGQAFALESHGLLLGVMPETSYDYSVLEILPGDLLILYSDGISEAMDDRQRLYRSEGIIATIRDCGLESPTELLNAVWSGCERHAGATAGLDDRTLLVLRFDDAK